MSIALWCVLLAALLPYATVGFAKGPSQVDNSKPRDLSVYQGRARRAYDAHLNAFEAFPFFAVAVIVASFGPGGGPSQVLDGLACAFIGLRILYIFAYMSDRSTLRSSIWGIALLIAIAIFLMPVWHAHG